MKNFEYGGLTFTPVGYFVSESFEEIRDTTKDSSHTPNNWRYFDFYEKAKQVGVEKYDKYEVNGVVVTPTEKCLREFI